VLGQTQLLFFSALAFTLLILSGIYPAEMRCLNVDADWFYRKGARLFYRFVDRTFNGINSIFERVFVKGLAGAVGRLSKDLPARISLLFLVSFWILRGVSGKRLEMKKTSLYNDISKGTLPVGIGAGVAAVFIILIFVLT
jgi:multicomponent Na+:H+ antiporter subunit D